MIQNARYPSHKFVSFYAVPVEYSKAHSLIDKIWGTCADDAGLPLRMYSVPNRARVPPVAMCGGG